MAYVLHFVLNAAFHLLAGLTFQTKTLTITVTVCCTTKCLVHRNIDGADGSAITDKISLFTTQ